MEIVLNSVSTTSVVLYADVIKLVIRLLETGGHVLMGATQILASMENVFTHSKIKERVTATEPVLVASFARQEKCI